MNVKAQMTRLLCATVLLAVVAAAGSLAIAVGTANAAVTGPAGICYTPANHAPWILNPAIGIKNAYPTKTITLRGYAQLVDYQTNNPISGQTVWLGDISLKPGETKSFPEHWFDLSFRTLNPYFQAVTQTRVGMLVNGQWAFVNDYRPVSYDLRVDNPYVGTFFDTGRYVSTC